MDNLKDRGPRNRARIALTEDWEVKWWTVHLAISVSKLTEVVAKVGNSATKVREYLKENK